MKDVLSSEGLRRVGISMVTAGLAHELGDSLDINLTPQGVEMMDHLQSVLLHTCVQIPVEAAFTGDDFGDILRRNLVQGAASFVGGYGASQIGQGYKTGTLSGFEQKLLHGALGAVTGMILEGDLEHAFAGTIGAVAGEIVAEEYKKHRESAHIAGGGEASDLQDAHSDVYRDMVEKGVAIAKMTAATTATLLGQDPDVAAFTAGNAVRHNMFQILVLCRGASVAWSGYEALKSAYEIYEIYQEQGKEAALKEAGVEIVTRYVISKSVKVGTAFYKIGGRYIPVSRAKEAWRYLVSQSPALQAVEVALTKGKSFAKSVSGKVSKKADELYKDLDAFGQRGVDKVRSLFGFSAGDRAVATASNAATAAVNRGANKAPPQAAPKQQASSSSSSSSTKKKKASGRFSSSSNKKADVSEKKSVSMDEKRLSRLRRVNDRYPINGKKYANRTIPLEELPLEIRHKYPHSISFSGAGFPDLSR